MSCSAPISSTLSSSPLRPRALPAVTRDARGVIVSPTDPETLVLYEKALGELQRYVGDPVATIDAALEREPDFVLGHAFRALVLGTFAERRFMEMARVSVTTAEVLASRATPRERGLVSAARHLVDGAWADACRDLERVLVDHPRDALAIQVAHLIDFYRGDALNLRNRISRVLPHWSPNVPGYGFILGMHAFGLEECNQYREAEATARRALALEPKDGWAVHAVTHVMEMEGRIDEGIAWLEERERDWAPNNTFAFHNYWHLALFYLDRERYEDVLALYDTRLSPAPGADAALQLIDATALLWRLYLGGVDVATRAHALAHLWATRLDEERGFYAFNDVHAMMAFTMAEREADAVALNGDLTFTAERARGDNASMACNVGLPVARGIRAFARGRYAQVLEELTPVRDIAAQFGGSHAQRDILTLTMIEAALRGGDFAFARHLLAERAVHRPGSALGWRLRARATGPSTAPERTVVNRKVLPAGHALSYAERGSGRPVVFLHGITDSFRSFDEVLSRLPAGLRGIAISHRGHGDSDRPSSGFRIADFASDVVALLDALGLRDVTLVGHSMGSLVAQEVAVRYPERVARLVLVGSARSFDNMTVRTVAAEFEALPDPVPWSFAYEFQASTIKRAVARGLIEAMTDESVKMPARIWRDALAGVLAYRAPLNAIKAPTLVMWGAHDAICAREDQDELRDGIRGARLQVYEDMGHTPHWEDPARFVEDLVAFISER